MPRPKEVIRVVTKVRQKYIGNFTFRDFQGAYYTFRRSFEPAFQSAAQQATVEGRTRAKASFTRPTNKYLGDAIVARAETRRPAYQKVFFGIIKRRGTFKTTSDYWQFVEFGAGHFPIARGFFIPFGGTPYTGQLFIPLSAGAIFKMIRPTPARRFLRYMKTSFKKHFKVTIPGKVPSSAIRAAQAIVTTINQTIDKSYKELEAKYRGG